MLVQRRNQSKEMKFLQMNKLEEACSIYDNNFLYSGRLGFYPWLALLPDIQPADINRWRAFFKPIVRMNVYWYAAGTVFLARLMAIA